jgi:hypothetical protein
MLDPLRDHRAVHRLERDRAQDRHLPAEAKWGGVISVDPAANGDMWVFHRADPPLMRFNPSGRLVKSFWQGMIV